MSMGFDEKWTSSKQVSADLDLGESETIAILPSSRRRQKQMLQNKCACSIPKRHVFTFLTFVASTLAVAFSSSVSIAIVSMVNRNNSVVRASNECRADSVEQHKKQMKGDFDWDTDTEGFAIAAVFYGQIISFVPGGRLAELCGGKVTLILSLLVASVLNFLIPASAYWSVYAFLAVRLLIGIFLGPVVPALLYLIGHWIPAQHRSSQSSIIFSGYGVGCFVASLLGGLLCDSAFLGGWPSFFYICGLYGIIWCTFAYFLIYEKPKDHPTISDEELAYITKNLGHEPKQISKVPWGQVFTSFQMWLLGAAYFGQFWNIAFFFTVEPLYMGTILKLSIAENGQLSSLPHFARAIFTIICSYPVDWILEKGYVSRGFIRKGATALNSFVSCIGFAGILLSGCDPILTTVFFTVGSLLGDFITFGVSLATIEIAPNLAGTMCGLYNLMGVSTFIILPSLVGWVTRYQRTMLQWRYIFFTSIGVVSSTAILYALFGSVEPQPWGTASEESDVENGVSKESSAPQLQDNETM